MSAPGGFRPPRAVVEKQILAQSRVVERFRAKRSRLRRELAHTERLLQESAKMLRQLVADTVGRELVGGEIDREAAEELIDRAMGEAAP